MSSEAEKKPEEVSPLGDGKETQETRMLALDAYHRATPALDALRPEELLRVNLQVGLAVRRALGALPAIREMVPQIERQAPRFAVATLDEVELYGLATWYAHAILAPTRSMAVVTNAKVEEARALKATLLVSAQALAHHGYLDAKAVAEIPKRAGHERTVNDLLSLAAMMKQAWGQIRGHVPLSEADLERAEVVGTELVLGLGTRAQPGAKDARRATSIDRRARAFTLFVRAYDECRRVVTYVRWHEGDADRIAPSLFTKSTRRPRRRSGDAPEELNGGAPGATGATGPDVGGAVQ